MADSARGGKAMGEGLMIRLADCVKLIKVPVAKCRFFFSSPPVPYGV